MVKAKFIAEENTSYFSESRRLFINIVNKFIRLRNVDHSYENTENYGKVVWLGGGGGWDEGSWQGQG